MKRHNIALMAMAALLLSSCGLYKNYERPADITAQGVYGSAQSGDSLGLGDLQWRQVFTDPQLQALIERGLENNADMRKADLHIQEAQYALKAAKLSFLPGVYFNPSGTIGTVVNLGTNSKTYELPLAASWQVDCFGQLRNAKKRSEVQVENMQVIRQAVHAALVTNIADMYYTLCMLDEQLAISQQTAENWGKNLEITRALMAAGQSNAAAVSSTEANYYAIQANVLDLEHAIVELENVLSALVGDTPGHIARGTLDGWQTPSMVTTGVPMALLSRRPDVRQAELSLATAYYACNEARAAFYPQLKLTGSLDFANSVGGAIMNPGKLLVAGIAGLTQPIFAQGKLRANKRITEAQMQEAQISFQQKLLDAGSEVNTAVAAIHVAESKQAYIAQQVEAQKRAVTATQLLMQNSSVNYLQVLTAQTSLLSAQLSEVSNRRAVISNTIGLYQALGGGTE